MATTVVWTHNVILMKTTERKKWNETKVGVI